MSLGMHLSAGRVVSVLAIVFALASSAHADQWRGHPACPHGPEGPGGPGASCPAMSGPAGSAYPDGKVLGVHISDLPNALLDAANVGYGVSVEQVRPDTAAAAGGIRAGDLITEFAGRPVLSTERLRWLVRKAESGRSLEVRLLREGSPVTVNVTLPEAKPKPRCDTPNAPKLGT